MAFDNQVQLLGTPTAKLRFGLRGDSQVDRNILALPPGDLRLREVPLDGDISYGSTLSFEYVVQPGDSDSNGLTIVGSGLTGLGEGTIAFERLPYTDGRYADIDFPARQSGRTTAIPARTTSPGTWWTGGPT